MTLSIKMFGYKRNGSACLFELAPGDELPPEWSSDILTIEDPEKRTGEAITFAARESVKFPVRVGDVKRGPWLDEPEDAVDQEPLRYDQDLNQVLPMKRRGRPPGSRNVL
jgi:hypothetical protein